MPPIRRICRSGHPRGSEVIFSVRQIELTDDEFDRDCRMVVEDLERLRSIVESGDRF